MMIAVRVLRIFAGVVLLAGIWVLAQGASAGAQTSASQSFVVLVDVSGSMDFASASDPSQTRLEVAQAALVTAFGSIPAGSIDVGLRTFHAGPTSECGDLGSLVVPVGPADPAALVAAVGSLSALGGTPTDEALLNAVGDLPATGERTIILISDGESTCGDPCATAQSIIAGGTDVTMHTVGFGTGGSDAETELACIAASAGGTSLTVDDQDGLEAILDTLINPPLPPVTVTFTLSQIFGCDEETGTINTTLCPGGSLDPIGGADYRTEISFDGRPTVTLDGDRNDNGDYDDGRFVVTSETFSPSAEVIPVTVKVFDADIGADDQVDVSGVDDELIATIDFNTATGAWSVDGVANRHWLRGDGDGEHGGGGHATLLTFDLSNLQAGPNRNATAGDSDGDGLLDGWERFGLEVIDMTQPNPVTSPSPATYVVLDPSWGADVDTVDMFIENDWVGTAIPVWGHDPGESTYGDIVESFALAPVPVNTRFDTGSLTSSGTLTSVSGKTITPTSGEFGIDLGGGNQIDLDTGDLAGITQICSVNASNFYAAKAAHFDLNRRWVFRYAITGAKDANITNDTTTCLDSSGNLQRGGNAEIGGNDILNLRGDAAVMMHELGHSLTLRHGGDSNEHCKPNYMSVMNYSYDRGTGIPVAGGDWLLDFSPARQPNTGARSGLLADRDENLLDEAPFDPGNTELVFIFDDGKPDPAQVLGSVAPDFNADGDRSDTDIAVNISANPSLSGCRDDTDLEVLTDHNDWAAISVAFRRFGDSKDAAINPSDDDDYANEQEAREQQLALGRADLELTGTQTATNGGTVIELSATSLDQTLVLAPRIDITAEPAALSDLPDTCQATATGATCRFHVLLESPTGSLPTAPATLRFTVTGDTPVTATITSLDNDLNNDPNPDNNTVEFVLNTSTALICPAGTAPIDSDNDGTNDTCAATPTAAAPVECLDPAATPTDTTGDGVADTCLLPAASPAPVECLDPAATPTDTSGDGVADTCLLPPASPAPVECFDPAATPTDTSGDGVADMCLLPPLTPITCIDASAIATDTSGNGVADTCVLPAPSVAPLVCFDENATPTDTSGDGVADTCVLLVEEKSLELNAAPVVVRVLDQAPKSPKQSATQYPILAVTGSESAPPTALGLSLIALGAVLLAALSTRRARGVSAVAPGGLAGVGAGRGPRSCGTRRRAVSQVSAFAAPTLEVGKQPVPQNSRSKSSQPAASPALALVEQLSGREPVPVVAEVEADSDRPIDADLNRSTAGAVESPVVQLDSKIKFANADVDTNDGDNSGPAAKPEVTDPLAVESMPTRSIIASAALRLDKILETLDDAAR